MSTSPPIISIVLAVYNDLKYLNESIQSVLNQSFEDFELLILDDGSDQPVGDMVRAFDDDRIKYHRLKHSGVTSTRNKGLGMSRGKYIAIQDADDIAHPDRFKCLLEMLEGDSNIALVGSNCEFIDDHGNHIGFSDYPSSHTEILTVLESLKNPFPHSSIMFRRDTVESLGGYDEHFLRVSDYNLYFRIIEKRKVASCNKVLCKIRYRSSSISRVSGTKEQVKYTALAYILHKYRISGLATPSTEGTWHVFYDRFEIWYYENIGSKVVNLWVLRMEIIASFKKGEVVCAFKFLWKLICCSVSRAIKAQNLKSIIDKADLNAFIK